MVQTNKYPVFLGAKTAQVLDIDGVLKSRYTEAEIASFKGEKIMSPFEKILAQTVGTVRDKISEIAVKQLMEDLTPIQKEGQYKSLKETLDKVFESYSKFPEERFQSAIADQKNKLLLMVKTEVPQYERFVFNNNLRNPPGGPTGSIRSSGIAGGVIGAVLGGTAGSQAGSGTDAFRATSTSARREMDPQVEANLEEMVADVEKLRDHLRAQKFDSIVNGSPLPKDDGSQLRHLTKQLMESMDRAGKEYGMNTMDLLHNLERKIQNPQPSNIVHSW